MNQPTTVVMQPAIGVRGSVRVPGDKSISHRYAMLGALATGVTRLKNFSTAHDCFSTLNCMRALGADWKSNNEGVIEIQGRASGLAPSRQPLDCGNSGSTMRMLSGILAAQTFVTELFGDDSLSRRPMQRIITPLTAMGARIDSSDGGRPPLRIHGSRLKGITYTLPVASAQVKTAMLFAGLLAKGETRVEEPLRTRDHGELALKAFGAEIKQDGLSISIRGGQPLQSIEARVPGDLSSAAFFLCAAALFPESHLILDQVLMNPTRARLLDWLSILGLQISVMQLEEQHGELVGTLEVCGDQLRGGKIAGADTAALIDEIPVLAAIAPFTQEGIEVRDAKELRVKESDRIAAMAAGLRAMGARIEEYEDGFSVPGGQQLHGAEVQSFGDHRIAMALAVAALRASGETKICGAEASAVSFPGYFDAMTAIAQR
jgi:3-phosphoshikimate 1-carboxyvinyltransferase